MFGQSSFWFHVDTEIQFPHSLSCVQVLRFICFGSPYFIYVVLMIVAYPEWKITKREKVELKIMHPFICISSKHLRIKRLLPWDCNMSYFLGFRENRAICFIFISYKYEIFPPNAAAVAIEIYLHARESCNPRPITRKKHCGIQLA